jgi:hypothetical protein
VKLIDETMRAFSFYEQQQSNCPSRDCPRTPKRASASFMQSGEVEKFSVLHLRVKTVIYRMSIFFESIIAYKPRKSVPRNSSHVQRTNAYITWYYARVTPLFGSHIDILPLLSLDVELSCPFHPYTTLSSWLPGGLPAMTLARK